MSYGIESIPTSFHLMTTLSTTPLYNVGYRGLVLFMFFHLAPATGLFQRNIPVRPPRSELKLTLMI